MTLNTFLRGTAIASVFAALLAPFIVLDNFFFPFITGKGFYFRIVVEIGFAAWLLLAFRDASSRPRPSLIFWSFVAFIGVIALADIFGENPWKSFWSNFERMEGFITLAHLFLYFVMAGSVLATEKLWKRFLETSVASAFVMAVYSFFQLAGALVINQGGVRVDGKFGNATYLAIFLVFNIFFALILAFRSRNERLSAPCAIGIYSGIGVIMFSIWVFLAQSDAFSKGIANLGSNVFWVYAVLAFAALITWLSQKYSASIAYVYTVPVLGFVLYFTATRGAILGIIGGVLLSALLIAIFDRGERRLRIIAASVIGLVFVAIGTFIAIKDTQFVAQSPVLGRFVSISWSETKTQARAYIWPMAVEGWKERPILGWGQENFNYIFNKNYDPRMYSQEQWFDHTHNIVLDWLVAGGILGLLAYLSMFAAAIYLLWKKATSLSFTEKALLTGLGAAYFFHNLFVFDNLISYVLFVSVLAYIHFSSTRLEKPMAADAAEVEDSETMAAGALMLVVLIFGIYFFNWRAIASNTSLIDALRSMSVYPIQPAAVNDSFAKALSYDTMGRPEIVERLIEASRTMNAANIPMEQRTKFFELSKKAVEAQIERYPGDARYEVFAANFYAQYGAADQALAHLLKAVELSPKKQTILFQLGSLHAVQGRYSEALDVFKRAYELEPSYGQALRYYVSALVYNGKEAEARALISKLGLDAASFSEDFVSAYAQVGQWDKAIAGLKAQIAANPTNPQIRMNLVAAYFQSGNKAMAIAALREMIALDPAFKTQGEQYIQQIQATN
ncbi:MAG TPA: O-antigen ligase family protein [Candidatus Paceibacterota bacterium]